MEKVVVVLDPGFAEHMVKQLRGIVRDADGYAAAAKIVPDLNRGLGLLADAIERAEVER